MREYEPFNPNSDVSDKKLLITNRLLAVSLTIYALTFVIFVFQDQLGMSRSTLMTTIPIALVVALGLNIAGLIKGIYERKIDSEMAINGIIGNLIPIILAIIIVCCSIYVISSIGEFRLNFKQ